jgi:hypothetical protein
MRAHEIKEYDSVLQALSEPGCPICAFLKNAQAKLLQQENIEEIFQLCNAHAWGVAAVRQTETAARIFLSLLENGRDGGSRECSICLLLEQEEILRTQELIANLQRRPVVEWMKKHGVLCLPHGSKLKVSAPISARALIELVLKRRTSELRTALTHLISDAAHGSPGNSGLLGKAAEYLVAQRGISLVHH